MRTYTLDSFSVVSIYTSVYQTTGVLRNIMQTCYEALSSFMGESMVETQWTFCLVFHHTIIKRCCPEWLVNCLVLCSIGDTGIMRVANAMKKKAGVFIFWLGWIVAELQGRN